MDNEMMFKSKQMVYAAMKGLKPYPHYSFGGHVGRTLRRLVGKKVAARDRLGWPSALLAQGLVMYYRNNLYSELSLTIKNALVRYYKRFINSRQKLSYLDTCLAGLSLIDIHQITADDRYKAVLDRMARFLKEHVVDEGGTLPYRPAGGNTHIYADTMGLICPFLCRYGKTYDDPGSISLGVKQLLNFSANGMDERSGLPYHGYDYKSHLRHGIIGWGRSCGWLMMGMIESLIYLDPQSAEYEKIKQNFRHLVDKVETYQREDGMFTWQLSAKEGPIDTSATAMIFYAIARGIEHEILIPIHRSRMIRGRDALLAAVTDEGKIYDCQAQCEGFGLYPPKFDAYPWSLGPALALFSVNLKEMPE